LNTKYKIFNVALGLLIALAVIIIAGWLFLKPAPMVIQGEVDATQIRISSKVAGRISQLHVSEGDRVTPGQLLVSLESPEMQAKLVQAKAAEQAAMAQEEKAQRGERKENIQAAYNDWMKAKAAADLGTKTYQRMQRLYLAGGVSTQQRDEAQTQMQAAIETAKAAQSIYEMAQTGARIEDKQAARAQVEQAGGAVSEVEAYLRETALKSPSSGEVSTIVAEQGEIVSAGYPIINMVDLSDVWVTFNMREDLMARVRMGDVFEATFPALGQAKIKLKVTYINALGSYATWNATKTSGDFDMKTFEVRARPLKPNAALRPGMTALLDWDSLRRH